MSSTKSSLSSARRQLLELLQRVNFGRVENLQILGGQPVLDPRPRVVVEHKFVGGENGPRAEIASGDFLLRSQVTSLFALLDRIGDGTIGVLSVKHGLPFHAELPG